MHHDILVLNQNFKDLNPLLCGVEECCKSHEFGPASREYFLIHYIVDGKGKFKIRDKTYILKKGNIFIIRPNEITYYEADNEDPWKYIWIGFNLNLSGNLFEKASFLRKDILYSQASEYIFRSMLESEKFQISKEIFLTSKLYELFSILIEEENNEAVNDFPKIYVMKAESYILANYMREITVESISNYLGINRGYFSTIFKKSIGKSPKQYIIDVRLEKAARFLLENNFSPSEAARSTGYIDIFNFSKMFKKKFGVSPLYYKSKMLK
ncbi:MULTISPECIES: AraC family transcriptional regulator [unclassified Clostridium]|uniref:AraC family transcriptional regulator n=1 Tax=unclassified Clostridium TaxID=2614128 RepID=UPI00029814D3|nr:MULTISPECIES: AraC family transcriptional regulator [unclassified Clostridium]EKQ56612.1 MAG: DNA-binding domain-containing protein, AraC-type [Clostridium sp. Maddingley MBC34-26]